MIRVWIGTALLAGSWLLGLGYFQPTNWPAWVAMVVLGTLALVGTIDRLPDRRQLGAALVLLLPVAWFMPLPYKAGPVLIAVGLAVELEPVPRRWLTALGRTALAAGVVLLAQSLTMLAYAVQTARSHELPWPLPWLVGAIAKLVGADAATVDDTVAIHSMRELHRLGATWELLLDPATLCFFVGGLAMLGLAAWSRLSPDRRWSWWLGCARTLTLLVAAWLPIRLMLVLGLYLHRALRAEPTIADVPVPPTTMDQFLSVWVHVLLLVGPVLLAARFVRLEKGTRFNLPERPGGCFAQIKPGSFFGLPTAIALACLAVGLVTFVVQWDPVGSRKAGRVMVVERHSTWEPTIRRYSTDWYGELASYNYAALYDFCGQYFQMSRLLESDTIDDETLSKCDVLIVKTPTARWSREEVEAVGRFVSSGGGLLLVGDHTNVFKTGTYLNDIARTFGFAFRDDLLFHVGTPYEQFYRRPAVPHPAVQHVPWMDFAVSCSIDPGTSPGRAVVRTPGMWNLPPAYHTENYHPQAEYRPEMRYGSFVQVWAARHGSGRVLAFTDSTIFSNFCVYQPGKAELFRNMVEWLNHGGPLDNRWLWLLLVAPLVLVGAVMLIVAEWFIRHRDGAWLSLLSAGLLGWTAGSIAAALVHGRAMPVPENVRPLEHVVIDRTVSEVPQSLGAFIRGEGEGYGLFEQWIPRLGYLTSRRKGNDALSGDALVVLCPTRSVSKQFRQRLVRFVADGGKLLVVDSPDNDGSTANSLLWPFGLGVNHSTTRQGTLKVVGDWPGTRREAACEITGGKPIARLNDLPVAATINYDKGMVMVIGFGYLFNDAGMGYNWMVEPNAEMRTRFDLLFELIRAFMTGRPVAKPPRS